MTSARADVGGAGLRAPVLVCLLALLAACAPVRVRESAESSASQTAREAALAQRARWRLSAHIFVSDGGDNSGSGELEWQQDGERYVFIVHAPVTGKTWKLSGDSHQAQLEGVEPEPARDSDPERLLRERLGWAVPLGKLQSWVRALRAPASPAEMQFDAANLPAVLKQDGWTIEYRDWFEQGDPLMPKRVFATHGKARVRMAIEHWSFE